MSGAERDQLPLASETLPQSVVYRLHLALMPDYNRKAALYWYTMVVVGTTILAYSLYRIALMPSSAIVQTIAGTVLAAVAGTFPVRIPNSKNSIAAGDVFLFLMLLMLGPVAATVAAVAEAAFASWLTSKRWTSRIASPAMAAISMLTCGLAFQAATGAISGLVPSPATPLVELIFVASVYYALNTLLMTTVIKLKRDEPIRPLKVLSDHLWLGFTYVASASIAGLLFITYQQFGTPVLFAAAPIIVMLLATLHHFFNQLDADQQARTAQIEAADREAEQTARHIEQLKQSEQRFESAFTHASIGMALVKFDGVILQVNEALCALLGRSAEEMRGLDFRDVVADADEPAFSAQLASVNGGTTERFRFELRCKHKTQGDSWVAMDGSFFAEAGADGSCLILQLQDIEARRQAESRLKHIAFHDGLTGLLNRNSLLEALQQAILRETHGARHQYALMFLDLDRFKLVNDSMGHSVGDEMLVQVTHRIREKVRPSDVVARLGGDEFAILCRDIESESVAVQLAERLQQTLLIPFHVAGSEVMTSASIGITFSRFNYQTPEEALRDADIAMYRAKNSGKARYALFNTELHREVAEKVELERELRRAVEAGEISPVYQPLFEIANGRLHGFEALARWHHPTRGLINPDVFLSVAEELGLMTQITDRVLERSCRQLRAWQQRWPSLERLQIHVNIADADLRSGDLVSRVERIIRDARLDPSFVTIEVTESVLMPLVGEAAAILGQLRQTGVSVSIDDFGTGYSSLSHLSTLPVDSLKIDRSFVHLLRPGSKEAAIIRAILSLANALGKTVFAEGVETEAQALQLREMDCVYGQGFHFSQPMAPERVEFLLSSIEHTHWQPGQPVTPPIFVGLH